MMLYVDRFEIVDQNNRILIVFHNGHETFVFFDVDFGMIVRDWQPEFNHQKFQSNNFFDDLNENNIFDFDKRKCNFDLSFKISINEIVV